ncbi:hypothetical protein W97_04296 [Coniosporium apollinis CBS 100218]|uniref:ATP-dependent RNA helicase DHX8 n=1 Tax=Coniosporium apollinis (strain CBS 100218) TaxID=1168221 RepID=R7YTR6_CONA1|nr:uncharacterized protein W97_04296 [Coniosporium apollinis CBS 100218]EON65061.1 hypothetical protein W97_04296 [Coniosporium apollinis CBS 100218]
MATIPSTTLSPTTTPPARQIRALYDDDTITVYQAYSSAIAEAAVASQRLDASADFATGMRMTWIKPSWCWMLYRSGYSYKDARQERILALKMRHADFLELLRGAHVNEGDRLPGSCKERWEKHGGGAEEKEARRKERLAGSRKVVVQWDPERSPRIGKLAHRSIQIGISPALVGKWVGEMIVGIEDVTERARELKRVLDEDERKKVGVEKLVDRGLVPLERVYEVPEDARRVLGMDVGEEVEEKVEKGDRNKSVKGAAQDCEPRT